MGIGRCSRSAARTVSVIAAAVVITVAVRAPVGPSIEAGVDAPPESLLNEWVPGLSAAADAARIQPGRGYAYLLTSPNHRLPARWCPGEIGFTVDYREASSAGLDPRVERQLWQDVLDQWSYAAGGAYRFRYLGARPLGSTQTDGVDVSAIAPGTIGITYVHAPGDPAAPRDRISSSLVGRTAGNGGLQVVSHGPGDAAALIGDRGFVIIDVADAVELRADGLRRALYQHESGHAVGLGHVDNPTSIMNGTLGSNRVTLSENDVTGIRSLAAMPCEP